VDVTSLGFRTDLMLRRLAGSDVIDRGDHIVVRTPTNPNFWWGNFVLMAAPPQRGDGERWRTLFAAEFPTAGHLAFGVDGTTGDAGDPAELTALGVTVERSVVLTAAALAPPARPNTEATYRPLTGDDDWAQAGTLRHALYAADDGTGGPQTNDGFVERRLAELRGLCDRGHAVWFGAFTQGALRSMLGVVSDGSGIARYQDVETHPEHRGQGLASTLVHLAGAHAQRDFDAGTLVIVADPDYLAIGIYRALGFRDSERQVQLQRAPDGR
jgi:ribosomal protein S18 acetylase RimI-like enzyme